MKTRKLIPKKYLEEFARLNVIGVPVRKIIRDNDLDVSHVHLAKLINYFHMVNGDYRLGYSVRKDIELSIFPEWLHNEEQVQTQPEGFKYIGLFPYGQWEDAQ